MDNKIVRRAVVPLFIFFIIVNAFCTIFKTWLTHKSIDPIVLGFANFILFIISLAIFLMQRSALKNPNPNAFVRSVMAGTFIKLFGIGVAVTLYLFLAGENKSVYAIVAAMFLYIVYTVIEVNTASKMNKKNGGN
jgi:hypothetical protein